ncbi:MAG: PIN domain-containing protein [Thainema sp.]
MDFFFAKDPPDKGEMIAEVINNQTASLIISTQILGELYNVLTRKRIFSQVDAQAIVLDLSDAFSVLEVNTSEVRQAIEINLRYGYSYWDSLVIATALQSNCCILYSEDMQHEQLIADTLRIINPLL